jgi:hypothetical protein
VSSYCSICVFRTCCERWRRRRKGIYVLILLYICPHTATYVSSYCFICVLILILLYMCPQDLLREMEEEEEGERSARRLHPDEREQA